MGPYLSAIAGILGVFGVIGGAMGTLMAGRQSSTVSVLKTDNEVLRDRVDTLEETERHCNERLAVLEDNNRALQSVVTGAAALEEIRKQQAQTLANQEKALGQLGQMWQLQGEMRVLLASIVTERKA